MVAIKFNGVRKSPGRPTLVEGIEGRRHVNNKILRALEASQKSSGGYHSYSTYKSSSDGMNWDDAVNKLGMELADASKVEEQEEVAESFQWYPTGAEETAGYVHISFEDEEPADPHTEDEPAESYSETIDSYEDNESIDSYRDEQPIAEFLNDEPTGQYQIEDQVVDEFRYSSEIEHHDNAIEVSNEDSEDETTSEIPAVATAQPCEEGFEIGPALRACIEETNSYPVITEHQMQCSSEEPLVENLVENETEEYFDYPESGMPSDYPQDLNWLEEFEQSEARIQRNRTSILRVPTAGVVRSSRGTVELLVHADGRMFKPIYNKCGILVSVDCSDGYKLLKNRFSGVWSLIAPNGAAINDDAITAVAFDKQGNLSYQTQSGRLVTLYVNGKIVTSA